jgi:NADH-quinone oxidoreductase subunit N
MTSAVMLYGFSLLYGVAGETNLYGLVDKIRAGQVSPLFLGGVAVLILAGFGFKVAAVPFHFWTPDVYEGAPTPITAFISTASKAAGFAVLVRFVLAFLPDVSVYWTGVLAGILILVGVQPGVMAPLVQSGADSVLRLFGGA